MAAMPWMRSAGRWRGSKTISGCGETYAAEVDRFRPLVHPWLYWNVCVSDDEMLSKSSRTWRTDILVTFDVV